MKRVRCALIAPIEMATGTQAYFCGMYLISCVDDII